MNWTLVRIVATGQVLEMVPDRAHQMISYGFAELVEKPLSSWNSEVEKRFPVSAKARLIFGGGPWLLISRCKIPWKIFMFSTEEARNEKYTEWETTQRGCRHGEYCMSNYAKESLF